MRSLHSSTVFFTLLALTATAATAAGTPSLAKFARAWAGLSGYSTTIRLYEISGGKTENATFAYTFRKPSTVTMDVVSGPNAGSTVKWAGGSTVVASKGRGLMGMFKKTVSLRDPMVTSILGYTVDDLSFASILAHARNTAGKMTESSGSSGPVLTLDVASPGNDNGLTREVLYLSSGSYLPTKIEGYRGSTMVRSYSFTNVKTS